MATQILAGLVLCSKEHSEVVQRAAHATGQTTNSDTGGLANCELFAMKLGVRGLHARLPGNTGLRRRSGGTAEKQRYGHRGWLSKSETVEDPFKAGRQNPRPKF